MTAHQPILLNPIVDFLVEPLLRPGIEPSLILDCTLGGGGHTAEILVRLNQEPKLAKHQILAIDRDPAAIAEAERRFSAEIAAGRLELRHQRFSQVRTERPVIGILADLGISSDQLADPRRGISFQSKGPLEMRMDPSQGESLEALLDKVSQRELESLLSEKGEERFSRRISEALIDARDRGLLPSTAQELAVLVTRAVPPAVRHGRIHPATRTFQALRIAVNHELEELDCLLRDVILFLKPGGRAAILSFHSLEDRRVKQRFRQLSQSPAPQEGEWRLLTKKPVDPDEQEVRANPRARSAHLRVIERVQ